MINYNGQIIPSDELIFSKENRAFRYGDAFFETMRITKGKVLFLNNHFKRMQKAASVLKITIPDYFNAVWLEKQMLSLCKENDIDGGARARLCIMRKVGGKFKTQNNNADYILEIEKVGDESYKFNKKGLITDVFTEHKMSQNIISNIKSTNCLHYILAGIYCLENNLDDCFLVNHDNYIAEATSSNVFVIKEDLIFTPDISSGCVEGVFRKQFIDFLKINNSKIIEKPIRIDELISADEVFICNVVKGINSVKTCGKSNFKNSITEKLFIDFTNKL